MTITVNMTKEEFIDYCSYKDLKSSIKCGIIDLNVSFNNLLNTMLEDGIWKDNNKYDKQLKKIISNISNMERGVSDANTEVQTKSIQ